MTHLHGDTATLSRDQVREVDRLAIEELDIPGIVLMENAGLNTAHLILDLLRQQAGLDPRDARVAVVCGGGNNGGDGYVIARQLHNHGVEVACYTVKDLDELTGDAAINGNICRRMELPIVPVLDAGQLEAAGEQWDDADVLVDAMLGTGFRGEVREPMASVIRQINDLDKPLVVAVDVPSGLDCQTGQPSRDTVRAQVTVTFVARKAGFDAPEARNYLGQVRVVSIGAPPELIDRVRR